MSTKNDNQIIFGDITTSANVDFFGEPTEVPTKVEKSEEVESTEEPKETTLEINQGEDEDFFGKKVKEKVATTEEEKAIEKAESAVESSVEKDYLALVKDLVEQGIFADFEQLSEIESLTKEEYESIKEQQRELQREEVKEEVLSSLDEEEKEFIEYKKNGGNIEAYMSSFMSKRRAEAIDISTDNGKKAALYDLYTKVDGLSHEKAQSRIQLFEKALALDEEAERADSILKSIAKQHHDKLVKEQADYRKSIEQAEEDYKLKIKENLKQVESDTKKVNLILKNFTERDAQGFTNIDKAYLSVRNNPEKAKFLHDILLNYEEFEKKLITEKTNENTLKTFGKIKIKTKRADTDVAEKNNKLTIDL